MNWLKSLLFGTVRRQLITGVTLVHAVLMTLLVWDLTLRQQEQMIRLHEQQAASLGQSIASSSAVWLLSRDITGIQEIIESQRQHNNLLYAMAIDDNGLVLAHTDPMKIGRFIADLPTEEKLRINNKSTLSDLTIPAILEGELVGWIRLGIDHRGHSKQISVLLSKGFYYTAFAIITGIILAMLMANRLTRRLDRVNQIMRKVITGDSSQTRVNLSGSDEVSRLADTFNNMLSTLETRDEQNRRYASALMESEQRLERALQGSQEGLWDYDLTTDIVFFSQRWKSMLGYQDDELENRFETWEKLTHPDDVKKTLEILESCIKGERDKLEARFRMQHKDGHWLYILSQGYPTRDDDGKTIMLTGTHQDISDQVHHQMELELQKKEQEQILNSMLDAVFTVHNDGTISSCNHSARQLFKLNDLESCTSDVDSLFSSDGDFLVSKLLDSKNKNAIRYRKYREFTARATDGYEFPVRLTVARLPDDELGKSRFVMVCHDLTTEKLQEMELRHSQKMEALGKLTGGISHDFNNMLGVILGYTELLKEIFSGNQSASKYLEEIIHAGERAKALTSKLLSFSRKVPSKTQAINLNQLLLRDQHMLEKTLTPKIQLQTIHDEKLWNVLLDPTMLDDALLNMCINSMHAMPDGGILKISTANINRENSHLVELGIPPGDWVELSVTDSGTGMDYRTRERIFEPFFTTKGEQGTGLGMSQVYGLVQQAGGEIRVDSQLGRGTTINLYFPRYEEQDVVNEKAPSEQAPEANTDSRKILIVDDEEALANVTADMLRTAGYEVATRNSAREALDFLAENDIDLVLSDVIMPDVNGYQLVKEIRGLYPGVKIQMMSGYYDDNSHDESQQELHLNRLNKPFSIQELHRTIATHF